MIAWAEKHSPFLTDLAAALGMAVFIAGMCLVLAWIAPLELTPPWPR